MTRSNILKFCDLLKDLGMFFEDSELILMLEEHFLNNYHEFELTELILLKKLLSYSFYQPQRMLALLHETLNFRCKVPEEIAKLESQDVLDFIEGLSVSRKFDKALSQSLVKVLKSEDGKVLKAGDQVPLFATSFISDFDLRLSE